jgi:hypothetical protein
MKGPVKRKRLKRPPRASAIIKGEILWDSLPGLSILGKWLKIKVRHPFPWTGSRNARVNDAD